MRWRPRLRSLLGRLAAVQVTLILIALATVVTLALATVSVLLRQDLDRTLMSLASAAAASVDREPERGHEDAAEWIGEELEEQAVDGTQIQVLDRAGRLIASSQEEGPQLSSGVFGACHDETSGWRTCVRAAGPYQILAGSARTGELRTRKLIFLGIGGAALVVAAAASALSRVVARRALAPLSQMGARVAEIAPGSGARVGPGSGLAELDALGRRFDDLLARVDEALARERRFAGEASHELRTPLTVLRGEIEALAGRSGAWQGSAERALTSVDELCGLVEALLVLSRAQAPFDRAALPFVNLADVLRDRVDELGRSAEHSDRVFEVEAPDEILVAGDERLLRHAVGNLLDNASKYSPPGAPVEVTLAVAGPSAPGQAVLTVRDHGPGVPVDAAGAIFEPFFRVGAARARAPGHGLGLPLARAVARAHGGEVALVPTPAGGGSCFRLELPAAGETPVREGQQTPASASPST